MRGEYGNAGARFLRIHGSPPHAWGIPGQLAQRAVGPRFTPTCVGNTGAKPAANHGGPVHPHMRGEYDQAARRLIEVNGSPPHAWGIPPGRAQCGDQGRFTPTCVGNTKGSSSSSQPRSVHPHMRGEYFWLVWGRWYPHGSPPHAWGILAHGAAPIIAHRFTPTCVGNTLPRRCPPRRSPVHPHMRGEYATILAPRGRATGSPPHAWGIPDVHVLEAQVVRFTPTCVGNTRLYRTRRARSSVHPHMRGEYSRAAWECSQPRGSPPHAWGILALDLVHWSALRFTPTCVGNTALAHRARSAPAVHPHMRGEYVGGGSSVCLCNGSPPHAWGILHVSAISGLAERFTPTCVGNTLQRAAKLGQPRPLLA